MIRLLLQLTTVVLMTDNTQCQLSSGATNLALNRRVSMQYRRFEQTNVYTDLDQSTCLHTPAGDTNIRVKLRSVRRVGRVGILSVVTMSGRASVSMNYTENPLASVDGDTSSCHQFVPAVRINVTIFLRAQRYKMHEVNIIAKDGATTDVKVEEPLHQPPTCCMMDIQLTAPDANACQCRQARPAKIVSIVFDDLRAPIKICEIVIYAAIDGAWSAWSHFGACSTSCGRGIQTRTRACDNPAPSGGSTCRGRSVRQRTCFQNCPVHGNWSPWALGPCSVTCGNGLKELRRKCTNPAPRYGGNECLGYTARSDPCIEVNCPIHGEWSSWTNGMCTVTCDSGVQIGTRTCHNPPPSFGGHYCRGDISRTVICKRRACTVLYRMPLKVAIFAVSLVFSAVVTLILTFVLIVVKILNYWVRHRAVVPVTKVPSDDSEEEDDDDYKDTDNDKNNDSDNNDKDIELFKPLNVSHAMALHESSELRTQFV